MILVTSFLIFCNVNQIIFYISCFLYRLSVILHNVILSDNREDGNCYIQYLI